MLHRGDSKGNKSQKEFESVGDHTLLSAEGPEGVGHLEGGGVPQFPQPPPIAPLSPVDPAKVSKWLEDADEAQCRWAVNYLCNQLSLNFHQLFPGEHSRDGLANLIKSLLCGDQAVLNSSAERFKLSPLAMNGADYLFKARNAWNQKVNRARKAAESANTIHVDAVTKMQIGKLASEHNLKEGEFLSILIDLLSERRGAVEGFVKQRKAVKKAAIASDLGLLDGFSL